MNTRSGKFSTPLAPVQAKTPNPKCKMASSISGSGGGGDFVTPAKKRGDSCLGTPGGTLLQIPPSPCLKRLGFGTGVRVFLYPRSPRSNGVARSPWAIKKLGAKRRVSRTPGSAPKTPSKDEGVDPMIAERLDIEAKILKGLNHPNIIGFRGFKRNSDGTRILAVENGDRALLDIIEERREEFEYEMEEREEDEDSDDELDNSVAKHPEPLPAGNIETVIQAMASALHYLHSEKRILHGDMKAANILILGDFEAVKLCDFGVTLDLDDKMRQKHKEDYYIGTGPWVAKEVDEEDGVVSDKTDIFALGCTIYEMLACEAPHVNKLPQAVAETLFDTDKENEDESFDYDDSDYTNALGTRPELPNDIVSDLGDAYERVLGIFYACTEEDPEKRPSAKMILDLFKEVSIPLTKNLSPSMIYK